MATTTWYPTNEVEIKATYNPFSRKKLHVNGQPVGADWKNGIATVQLPDGRTAEVQLQSGIGANQGFALRVDGYRVPPGVRSVACPSCKASAQPADARCGQCGATLAAGDQAVLHAQVQSASTLIFVLAGLFLLGGVAMFFIGMEKANVALESIGTMNATDTYPEAIEGKTMTVGELRSQINFEKYSPLVTNVLLAMIMVGLGLWSKRSALPALLTAAAVYGVVILGSAVMDPATIGRGIFMKVIIVIALANGIKAAFAARHSPATP